MYPKTFFQSHQPKPLSGTCFVLMPFAASFNEVYETIRESLENPEMNIKCKRADDILGGGHIMETVLREISESEMVIVDLTGRNPNVFYELGIAHMLKDPRKVILLTQDIESMPFDLTQFRSIVYVQSIAGAKQLTADLQNTIREVVDYIKLPGDGDHAVYQFSILEGDKYHFPVKLFGDENCLYDFNITPEFVGEDAVKFMLGVTRYAAGHKPEFLRADGFGLEKNQANKIGKIPWFLSIKQITGRTVTFQLNYNSLLRN